MKEKRGALTYVLIAVIALLFIFMLILCGLYLDLIVNGLSSSLPSLPENDKWILSNRDYASYSSANDLISPAFLGFKRQDGTMASAVYNESARKQLTGVLYDYIEVLFSADPIKVEYRTDDDKRALLNGIYSSDKYFFASFYEELPSAVFMPCISSGRTEEYGGEPFFVKYMFVLADSENNIYAYCIDGDSEAVLLYPYEKTPYNDSSLAAYNDVRGFSGFEFVSETAPVAVFTDSFDVDSVLIAPTSLFYKYDISDENTGNLLNVLDFNTNMVKVLKSRDDSTISFVENGKELYIVSDEGRFDYNGYDEGIHLSKFLKYYPQSASGYTFSDKVLAVKYLLNSFDRLIVGGDALPALTSVTYSDDSVIFRLKYFFNGILLTDSDYDISVEIDENAIKRIEIDGLFCDRGTLKKPSLPEKMAISVMNSAENAEYYAIFKIEQSTNQVSLVWAEKVRGEN